MGNREASLLPMREAFDDDILFEEILVRLPLKSLARFKSVSKSFKTVISSSEFARIHLRHSHSTSDNTFLITRGTLNSNNIYHLNSLTFSSTPSLSLSPSATFRWPIRSTDVVGSCNGLLLITITRSVPNFLPLVLLNPSTRTYIDFHSTDERAILGFGYNHFSNDYKIVSVSIARDWYTNVDNQGVIRVTGVYSVNSKSWKFVDMRVCFDFIERRSNNGVLINDHLLHWMFWSMEQSTEQSLFDRTKPRMGCFDVVSEKWKDDVALPNYNHNPIDKNQFLDMGVLDDGCLFFSSISRVNHRFDVWVLKEYGRQESWIKLFDMDFWETRVWDHNYLDGGLFVPMNSLFSKSKKEEDGPTSFEIDGGVVPVACRGGTEMLLRERLEMKMYIWYNWKNNTVIQARLPNCLGRQPYTYRGSLVSLPDAKLFGPLYQPNALTRSRAGDAFERNSLS